MNPFPLPKTLLSGSIAALLCATPAFAATPTTKNNETTKTPSTDTQKKDWSDRFTNELRDIQDRMENLFSHAWRDTSGTFHDFTATSGFTSSVNLNEEKDHYTVRVTLPERDIQNVDVRVEANNTMHIVAKEEEHKTQPDIKGTARNESAREYSMSRYEQTIALPSAVDSTKMTVDRNGSTLTITLPKLETGTTPPGK